MITTTVEVKNEGALASLGLAVSGRLFPDATRLAVEDSLTDMLEEFETELRFDPPPPGWAYGLFPWTSSRQKRAYFASEGFGRGIPTARSDVLVSAWEVEAAYVSPQIPYQIEVTNPTPYRPFVTGLRQQQFHRIAGPGRVGAWPNEAELYARYRRLFLERLLQEFPARLKDRLLKRRR